MHSSQAVVGSQHGTPNVCHFLCDFSLRKARRSLEAQHPSYTTAKSAKGVNECSPEETEAGLSHPMGQHLEHLLANWWPISSVLSDEQRKLLQELVRLLQLLETTTIFHSGKLYQGLASIPSYMAYHKP